ncbi:MAG: sugar transferase [Bacteroidetes bacterium HGW-Bacteroidetes-2]|jgi:exopolysaccharide biosynthesis polyprenyl glycosylphosphotransferase|nr:MAG: sugar transferase [Bacteroidetes bacterium HGW-Bacteroidetes-2]
MKTNSKIHFEISERKVLLRIFDVLSVLLVLYLVGILFNFDYFSISTERWEWLIVLALYISIFGTIFEMYDLQKASKAEIVFKNIILTVSLTVLFYLLTPFYTPTLPNNRLQIVYFFVAIVVALFLWRLTYITFISSPRFYKQILLLGNASDIGIMIHAIEKSDPNYKVIGYLDTSKTKLDKIVYENILEFTTLDIKKIIKEYAISEIIVATGISKKISVTIYNELLDLLERGFPIKEYEQVYEELTFRVPVHHVDKDFYRYFPFSRSNQNKLYLLFHQLTNIVVSLLGIVIGIILLPFILIGNLIGNRGELFYFQERVGKHGKTFFIIKLRSMVKDAEKDGAVWASKEDGRVTKFGRILRKTRIDEIPQFFNILKGDMSVIGPRPERPVFVKELSKKIPFYEIRHIIKPGLTGWAQVKGTYAASTEDALEKLQYDLFYIKKRSLFLDLNILLKTLSTVIFYRGY